MRHLIKLLPTALLVLFTKVWPSLGQAANTGCPSCHSVRNRCVMAEKLDPNDLVTLEDLAISSMWEVAALLREGWERNPHQNRTSRAWFRNCG